MSDIPRKSVETFGFRILNQVLSVLTSILLARTLGPYGKGMFTFAGNAMSILLTVGAGQSAAISWQYGRLKRPSAAVLNAMIQFLKYVILPMALVVAIIALVVPAQRVLIAVAVALPFAFLSQMSLGFFLADGNVRTCNVQSLIGSAGFLVVIVPALLLLHVGLTAVMIVWVASTLATFLYAVLRLRAYTGGSHVVEQSVAREQIRFGMQVSANAFVSLLNYRVDVFIIQFVLGAKALGIYSIAIGVGELMWQLSRPLAFSAFGTVASGSKRQAAQLTAKCVRHTLAMVTLGCALLFIAGPTIITLVYGQPFSGAGIALRFLLPGIVAYSMTPFLSGYFTQTLGKPNVQLALSTASTIVCAVITLVTIRRWGIVGGAFATSISYVGTWVASMLLFTRETGIPLKELVLFRADDVRPYLGLLTAAKNRAARLVANRRG